MTVLASLPLVQVSSAGTLLAAVKDASKATNTKGSLPVLTGLRLHQLTNGLLEISGFDYETSVTRRVAVSGELPDVLVPAALLSTALSNMNAKQPVTLAVDGGKFVVTQDRKRVAIEPLSIEDYPDLPQIPAKRHFTIAGEHLEFIGAKVAVFAGRDDYLPVLTGVRLELANGVLTAMATDRYRLALAELDVTMPALGKTAGFGAVTALVLGMPLIGRLFKGADHVAVTIDSPDRQTGIVTFHTDDTTVTVRTLDGEFPKVRSLFPNSCDTTAVVDPTQMLAAVKFAQTGCERNTPVWVDIAKDRVGVSGKSGEDNFSDTVDAAVAGPEVTVGINPGYFTDALKVWGKGHAVTIGANQPTRPVVFTSPAHPNLRVLQMPVRLNG